MEIRNKKQISKFFSLQLDKYKDDDFKKPLQVYFHNEEGLDAGGIRKEFFLLLTKEILNPKYGMFGKLNPTCKSSFLSILVFQLFIKKPVQFGLVISTMKKKKRCLN